MSDDHGKPRHRGDRPQLTDARAAAQEVADRLGGWVPGA